MKRKIIISIVILASIVFFVFCVKYETIIYLGMSSPTSDSYSIDAEVKIDGKVVTKDSINNNPYKYKTIRQALKIGFRRIEVLSQRSKTHTVQTIFILPNQYILIEFYPGVQNFMKIPVFDISNGFKPFRYE